MVSAGNLGGVASPTGSLVDDATTAVDPAQDPVQRAAAGLIAREV